ncbi:hypothetical protein Anapl_02818 [Anas platyrhynchos]|uniref:Uncharacterized protein n=1 Tax=Anas platyrhynchos TaxID=8839 RepID=R0LHR3_ANAPL|nr:hypothetical protein Anapl_02818 [Anas platyrhynchos]
MSSIKLLIPWGVMSEIKSLPLCHAAAEELLILQKSHDFRSRTPDNQFCDGSASKRYEIQIIPAGFRYLCQDLKDLQGLGGFSLRTAQCQAEEVFKTLELHGMPQLKVLDGVGGLTSSEMGFPIDTQSLCLLRSDIRASGLLGLSHGGILIIQNQILYVNNRDEIYRREMRIGCCCLETGTVNAKKLLIPRKKKQLPLRAQCMEVRTTVYPAFWHRDLKAEESTSFLMGAVSSYHSGLRERLFSEKPVFTQLF